MASAIS
jgi:hypothetical protein